MNAMTQPFFRSSERNKVIAGCDPLRTASIAEAISRPRGVSIGGLDVPAPRKGA
jgi:hypothetical protein